MRRTLVLTFALLSAACDAREDSSTEEPSKPDPVAAKPEAATVPAPKPDAYRDAPLGRWSVRTHDPRLHQLDDSAWAELVLELLSGVVQVDFTDAGMRVVAMGRASVAEQVGLKPGDLVTAFGGAAPPSPAELHAEWSRRDRTTWTALTVMRSGEQHDIYLWHRNGRRRSGEIAAAMVRLGIVDRGPSRVQVDRDMLALVAEHPRLGRISPFWEAFGLPGDASVRRIDADNVNMLGANYALAAIAIRVDPRGFEIVAVDEERELKVQVEVVPDLMDPTTLASLRELVEEFASEKPRGRPPRTPVDPPDEPDPETTEIRIELDRDALRDLLDPTQLARGARIVPSLVDAEIVGYKLYGIRRGTLFHRVGLKNGDMVQTVDGDAMTDPTAALTLMRRLEKETPASVRVRLVRRGKPVELTVELVDAP